ncbi:MAG: glycosyltransferase [Bacilli bacterium]|nr:glycosyltransferase [Bacilli bacterium]
MQTGFIIVNYNDYKTTQKLINNIIDYKIINKIVVVDNASTDDSYQKLIKINNDKLIVLKNTDNKGYGSGINVGAKYLKKIFHNWNIIISNADIIINDENDLIKLIDNLSDDNIGVIAPVINEHGTLNRGWIIPSPKTDVLLNLPYFYKHFKNKLLLYKNDYYKSDMTEVEVVSGCFFLTKLDILEKIDYFDENVFLYYEENILASKLKKINKKTFINNKIQVIHDHSVTIDKSINKIRKYKILKKSQFYFQTKYNKANVIDKFLLYISIKLGIFIQYLIGMKRGKK